MKLLLSVLLLFGVTACFHIPFTHEAKQTESTFSQLKSKVEAAVNSPASPEPPKLITVDHVQYIAYSPTKFEMPTLSVPTMNPIPKIFAQVAPILQSAAAPKVFTDAERWFWILVALCVVACVLAVITTHFLAAIKFGLAACLGALFTWLYGIVIGSFVLACFASFGVGLVVAWYILNGRHQFAPSAATAIVNARLAALEALTKKV
jgi:uncharacterized membrane protein